MTMLDKTEFTMLQKSVVILMPLPSNDVLPPLQFNNFKNTPISLPPLNCVLKFLSPDSANSTSTTPDTSKTEVTKANIRTLLCSICLNQHSHKQHRLSKKFICPQLNCRRAYRNISNLHKHMFFKRHLINS